MLSVSFAQAQHIGPPTSENFPFEVGIIMDGGTIFIHKKASKESSAQEFCIDGQFGSKTKGELYEDALHPTYKDAKVVPHKKAVNYFAGFRNQLISYFGKKALREIENNPVDLENVKKEEAEKLLSNTKNNDRIACQIILQAIERYRQQHNKKGEPKG